MPKGHAPKREIKKHKKKSDISVGIATPVVASAEVQIVRKKRKKLEEDEF